MSALTKKVETSTQNVGSHLGMVQFGPCQVPIGFLASFRKLSHIICLSGKGFKTIIDVQKGRSQLLCECAVERATKRLNQVKKEAFTVLGEEWLVQAKLEVEEDMESCRRLGMYGKVGGTNPWPLGSDQYIAWNEGFAERDKEIP